MARRPEWTSILDDQIRAARERPFSWGEHDCCLWPADVILAMCDDGTDLAAPYRGRYTTRTGAYRALIRELDGGELYGLVERAAAAAMAASGRREVPIKAAQRGDLVVLDAIDETEATMDALAIVDLSGRFVARPGLEGLVLAPLLTARRAWRV